MSVTLEPDQVPSASHTPEQSHSNEAELADLRAECAQLREKLANMEAEYHFFRSEFYANPERFREFENIDLDDLVRESAGPLEYI